MVKRKITVTVDEELVESVQTLGTESLSAVVNQALAAEVERRARAAALGRLLAEWDTAFGPVGEAAAAAACASFDDVDAVDAVTAVTDAPGRHRRGAA
jgi:post-segregation antitoxin (ccd killing protein)